MCDVGGGLPLWDEDGALADEDEYLFGFLGLSPGLVADLYSWSRDWETAVRFSKARRAWADFGRGLLPRVQAELGPDVKVTLVL
jgi:hypothetical protein